MLVAVLVCILCRAPSGAALRAHLLLGCSLRTWKERLSCLPSSLYYQSMHTAGCLYVRLKMTDNECATLPSRNQCESGNHNNSPLSPGVDMLDPAKLQHVVVSQQRSECCQTYTPPCSSYPEDYISCRGYIVLSKELRWHTRRKGAALSCGAVHVCQVSFSSFLGDVDVDPVPPPYR